MTPTWVQICFDAGSHLPKAPPTEAASRYRHFTTPPIRIQRQLARLHLEWAAQHTNPLGQAAGFKNHDFRANRSLRVGLLSADFCQHPVGRFALVLCHHISRNQFELFVYSNNKQDVFKKASSLLPHGETSSTGKMILSLNRLPMTALIFCSIFPDKQKGPD